MQRIYASLRGSFFIFAILLMANIWTAGARADEDQCAITLSSSLVLKDSSFTPVNMSFTPVLRIGREYLGTLVRYDGDANLVPSLAKSWEIGADNRSITFHLDPTCRWSDGAPITALQFKAGFETLFNPKTSFTANGGFAPLSELIKGANAVRNQQLSPKTLGLQALDETTFIVETDGPADLFLQALTSHNFTPLPTHWINAGKMKWPAPDIWKVASGPYVVRQADAKMVDMRRNPYFCKGQEKPLTSVRYLLDSPRQATIGMFLNGAIDGVDRFSQRIVAPLLKNVDQIRKFKFTAPGGSPDRVYSYLFVNQTVPELQDPRVKQAIALLIEYEFLASGPIMGTETHILDGILLPVANYRSPSLEYRKLPYSERVKKARALMEEAGYNAENRLRLDLPLRENHEFFSLGQAIGGMLSRGHFDVQTRLAGEGEDYYRNLDTRNFGVGLFLWGTILPDPSIVLRGVIDKRITSQKVHDGYHDLYNQSLQQDTRDDRFARLLELEKQLQANGHIIPLTAVTRTFILGEEFKLTGGVFLQATNLEPADTKACGP